MVAIVLAAGGCGDRSDGDGADNVVPISSQAASTPPPGPVDFSPTITEEQFRGALPAASALGAEWTGPADVGTVFPRLDNFVHGCEDPSRFHNESEEVKPFQGASASYRNKDDQVVLNTVQAAVGADTISRATAYLTFLGTIPGLCPDGLALGQYPFRMVTAPPRVLGDENLTLRISVTLPDGGPPLELDTGCVRVGGLVIFFYGTPGQVDEYLPKAVEAARTGLAGHVPGV